MPLQTNLNVYPYFDDYNEDNDYYRVLFRPSVSLQVRELNQLQTMLQKQIERFGDNIYTKGTIVDGCNFIFHNPLPYVKINDKSTDNFQIFVGSFKGHHVKNASGLIARIIETSAGYESTSPDLNTLFLQYLNHGTSGELTTFQPNEILTVYDPSNVVVSTHISTKSSGFSNTDIPVFLSAITVESTDRTQTFYNSSGALATFTVGETLVQDGSSARAVIKEVNTTANNTHLVLKIAPVATDLRTGNTSGWTFFNGLQFTTGSSKITAKLVDVIGSGATAGVVTDTNGGILSISVTYGGTGYYVEPWVSVAYREASTSVPTETLINNLSVQARTYKTRAVVFNDDTAIGTGCGLSVTEGIIYQKGYFSRVSETFVVVDKYNDMTDKVVGFDTREEIVDFRDDPSLYDNATGSYNYNAPGANRLKLTPYLVSITKDEAAANTDFFTIVEFAQGKPFKQNRYTKFNAIAKDMAQRTYEESGDYVLDEFLVSTISTNDFINESQYFTLNIDPGHAYVDGYRVQTTTNYAKNIQKGTAVSTAETYQSLNYGSYVVVNELGGFLDFSIGATVSLRNAARAYLTSSELAGTFAEPTAVGTQIGTARIRSLQLMNGVPGSPDAEYWLYLFDIRMSTGKNFADVRSIFYNGSNDGVADIKLTGGVAVIEDPLNSGLVFPSGSRALKNVTDITYIYRTVDDSVSCNTQGYITATVAPNAGEKFDYTSTLTENEKATIIVTPFSTAVASANDGGYVTTSTSSCTVTGTSTSFLTAYKPGDYIRIANSTVQQYKRIFSIQSATSLTLDSNSTYAFATANTTLAFPVGVPVTLQGRTERTVTAGVTSLTVYLANTFSASIPYSIAYNAKRTAGSVSKTVRRKLYVKLNLDTNVAGRKGPWCLGVTDIIRLNQVYIGDSTVSPSSDKITSNFWIDHNQNTSYYGLGYLYKSEKYNPPAGSYLLVEFDALTTTQEGIKTISSYPIDDTLTYSESSRTMNTVEIPEMYTDNDNYYDLRDYLDFRPYTVNQATITSTYTSATTNPTEPSNTNRFGTIADRKFPAPQSDCTFTYTRYLPRIDTVVLTSNNDFAVIAGQPGVDPKAPTPPRAGLLINNLIIPPYPSLPKSKSAEMNRFLNRKIASIKYTKKRQTDFTIRVPIDSTGIKFTQPRRYTMADIGSLERRIKSLEYYSTLSFTENTVNNLQIPSSVDTATNRFKFGFFVDNFTTTNFCDIDDPYYNAQIFNYQLCPSKNQFNCNFKFNIKDETTASCLNGDKIMLPSQTVNLINQSYATEASTTLVATTYTTTTETGERIVRTVREEISTTQYRVISKEIANSTLFGTSSVQTGTQTVVVGQENVTSRVQTGTQRVITGYRTESYTVNEEQYEKKIIDSNYELGNSGTYSFNVGKFKGRIYFQGGKQIDARKPILQRYENGTWVTVGVQGRIGDNHRTWTITYDYVPYSDFRNRNFRIAARGDGNATIYKAMSFNNLNSYWPFQKTVAVQKTRQVPVYADEAIYETRVTGTRDVTAQAAVLQQNANRGYEYTLEAYQAGAPVVTDYRELTPEEVWDGQPAVVTGSLFNSKMTALIEYDKIFTRAASLDTPYVDLAQYIQNDLGNTV